jgi:hypothetical protein
MENPQTWGKVKKTINEAIIRHHRSVEAGEFGFSDVTVIYNLLKERGFVVEDTHEPENDNQSGED